MKESDSFFKIVDSQKGFFTARQAVSTGIQSNNHTYYVKTGKWIREWRGVYRLNLYPFQDDQHYALWGVWSINRKGEMLGVYSHETALSIFDLSDVNPAKIHMTVPRGFRRHSRIPSVLTLHFSPVNESEYVDHGGYKVTKPFRTVADVVRGRSLSPEFIIQAVRQGIQTGKLTHMEYEKLTKMPYVGKPLIEMMKGHNVITQ